MSVRLFASVLAITTVLAACSTTQESPIYQQSTKYKVHSPYTGSGTTSGTVQGQATTSYASYSNGGYSSTAPVYTNASTPQVYHASTSSTGEVHNMQVNHACLDKEGNRKLIGTGVGGAVGALAGNELIGGTKGTIIGAVVGGAAGYGVGDITTNCDPIPVQTQAQTYTGQSYPSAPSASSVANYPASNTTTYSSHSAYGSNVLSGSTIQAEPVIAASSPQTYTAPTDSAYDDTFGTPGYHAMQANGEMDDTTSASITLPETSPMDVAPIPTPAPAPAPSQSAQTSGYPQYSAPTYTAPTYTAPSYTTPSYPSTTQNSQTSGLNTGGGTLHRVVEGDTVYSLSRKLCVTVFDIQQMNSLDGNFSIRLDDQIKLPASRC